MHVLSNADLIARLRILAVIACCITVGACSRDAHEESDRTKAPITPALSSQDQATPTSLARSSVSATLNAAGIPSSYEAVFVDEQLTRIEESRTRGASAGAGAYEFQGARLARYEGQALMSGASVQLELDPQGRVTKAIADGSPASAEEVSALRARAQLLRSHALAQRATQVHK